MHCKGLKALPLKQVYSNCVLVIIQMFAFIYVESEHLDCTL